MDKDRTDVYGTGVVHTNMSATIKGTTTSKGNSSYPTDVDKGTVISQSDENIDLLSLKIIVLEMKDKVSCYTSECVKDANDQSKAYLLSQCNEEDVTLAGFKIRPYFYKGMLVAGVTHQQPLAKNDRFNTLFALCSYNNNASFFKNLLIKINK